MILLLIRAGVNSAFAVYYFQLWIKPQQDNTCGIDSILTTVPMYVVIKGHVGSLMTTMELYGTED